MALAFLKRQSNFDNHNNDDNDDFNNDNDSSENWWWYSNTALAVKWCIVVGIFVIFLAWFIGGYFHAQRRMKKGLPPLAYHRWLLPRRQRARFDPRLQNQYMNQPEGYAMDGYAPPPPAYNHEMAPPPTYQPPEGASKVNPAQNVYSVHPPAGGPSQGSPAAPPEAYRT